MDTTTIVLSLALFWMISAYVVLCWVSRVDWVEDYHLIGALIFGPFTAVIFAYAWLKPKVRRLYRRERAYIVSKLEGIKWSRLGGR